MNQIISKANESYSPLCPGSGGAGIYIDWCIMQYRKINPLGNNLLLQFESLGTLMDLQYLLMSTTVLHNIYLLLHVSNYYHLKNNYVFTISNCTGLAKKPVYDFKLSSIKMD